MAASLGERLAWPLLSGSLDLGPFCQLLGFDIEQERGIRKDDLGAALDECRHVGDEIGVVQATIDCQGRDEAKGFVKSGACTIAGVMPVRAEGDVFATNEVLAPVMGFVIIYQSSLCDAIGWSDRERIDRYLGAAWCDDSGGGGRWKFRSRSNDDWCGGRGFARCRELNGSTSGRGRLGNWNGRTRCRGGLEAFTSAGYPACWKSGHERRCRQGTCQILRTESQSGCRCMF